MQKAIMDDYHESDIVIMAAAVCDYKPKEFSKKKIKKDNKELNIKLEKTTDILMELGKTKKNQFLVGFALENDDELSNAKNKLKKKNLDLIVLNSLNDNGAGFGYDTNKVTVICKSGIKTPYKLKEKTEVAKNSPELLVGHHYTRYIGDLSGGQILKKIAKKALNLKGNNGLNFYEFKLIDDEKKFKEEYSLTLNQLPINQKTADQIIHEANQAFTYNMKMFKELEGNLIAVLGKIVFNYITKKVRKGSTET